MTLPAGQTRKANALIKDLATQIKDLKSWRQSKGAKKRWSAHTSVQDTQRVTNITAAFEALEAFLKDQMPNHWEAQNARFQYTKAYTSWTWQSEKPEPNQNKNSALTSDSLAHLVGFILGMVDLAKTSATTASDDTRLKTLGIDTSALNTYTLFVKLSAKRSAKGNVTGTTPQDAFAQRVLANHAPHGMVNVPTHNKGRKTHLTLGVEAAEEAFKKQWSWSGAPTALPKLFEHPNLVSIFGELRYNPAIISASTHNPADYDKLLGACVKMADKVKSEGPLEAYLVFTSPIQSQSVLARCETSAKMVYLFSKLCHPIKGPLPTSARAIQHVCRIG
jgi:hypothetical protein